LSVLPGLKRAAYQPALHQAEAAYRGAPDNVEVLFALAMARYRLEKYKEAHEAMAPVAGLRPPWSLDSALQALISFRLGRAEEARAYLAKAQEQYKANPWEETAVLIREAEELLAQEGK
jgi:tetratricopeptide (TPR) repeat protein